MNTKDIIKLLCDRKGISILKLEKDLGFSNGSISKGESMKAERLLAIAKYFNVSMEYLMGTENIEYNSDTKTWEVSEHEYYFEEDAKEIAQFLFENPEYKVLFDASKKVKPEDIKKALRAIGIFLED